MVGLYIPYSYLTMESRHFMRKKKIYMTVNVYEKPITRKKKLIYVNKMVFIKNIKIAVSKKLTSKQNCYNFSHAISSVRSFFFI